MLRRLLFIGVLGFVVAAVARARSRRVGELQDQDAEAHWESEGGSPSHTRVDTPIRP